MTDAVMVDSLRELINRQQWERLRTELAELPFSDIAELIMELPPEEQGIIFRVLPRNQASPVFTYLSPEHQENLIRSLSHEQIRHIVDEMRPDDRAQLLDELPAEVTRRLLASLSPEELKSTRLLLGYPENAAGRYMTPEYVAVRPSMSAREALEHPSHGPQIRDAPCPLCRR
jgi:magnesium transporter